MLTKKTSHKIVILLKLLDGKILVSSDLIASNSNQYFGDIKKQGIELIEVWKPNLKNVGKHKERRLNFTPENIRRAKKYLHKLQGKKIDD